MHLRKKKCFNVSNSEKNDQQKTAVIQSNDSIFKGLLLGGISGVFFASTALLVKYMNNLPTQQLVLIRFIGILFLTLPDAVRYRDNILGPKQYRLAIFIRAIIGTTQILMSYMAFRFLPLGEASVIVLSYPSLVAIFAKCFLKEPCGIFQGFILVLTIIGVSLIAKLPAILEGNKNVYSKETTYGLLAGFASVTLNTCQILIVRKLKNIHHSVMIFNLGWIAILETSAVIAITGHIKWPDCGSVQVFLIILLAAFNYGSQIFIILALQCENAATVSIVRASVDITLSFVFQTFLFKDTPDKYSIIGAIILVISFILNGIKKWISSLLLDSEKFRYLRIILE